MVRILFFFIFLGTFLFSCNQSTHARIPQSESGYRLLDSLEKKKYNDSLRLFFDSLLNNNEFSGGILVAKNGQIVYEHYQGFADIAKATAINDSTPFHIASTSKTFTSTAILQLVRAGKLKLTDSLATFFPQFPYSGISVSNLLNHSSGLPYYVHYMAKYKWEKNKLATNHDILRFLYTYRPNQEFKTGSRFKYCNTNFSLLALIVEQVSGKPFGQYLQDSIFKPAGMTHSYLVTTENAGDFLPSWRNSRPFRFEEMDGIYGDKNVFSTCRDLMRYDSAINKNLLLDPLTYEKAWTPNYPDKSDSDSIEYYGLGWRLKVFNDSLKIPYHNGWWHGNNTVFQRLIADSAVIIVTGNVFNRKIYSAPYAANVFRPYYSAEKMTDVLEPDTVKPRPTPAKKVLR